MSQFFGELHNINPHPGPSRLRSDVGTAILKFACSSPGLADAVASEIHPHRACCVLMAPREEPSEER